MSDPDAIDREAPTCKRCGKPRLDWQVFCGAACSALWEGGKPFPSKWDRPAPHNGTPTSKAAAESLTPETLRGLRAKVYDTIAVRTLSGMGTTSDDIEAMWGARHQTISARVHELAGGGLIEGRGTRLTRSGRKAVAYYTAVKR